MSYALSAYNGLNTPSGAIVPITKVSFLFFATSGLLVISLASYVVTTSDDKSVVPPLLPLSLPPHPANTDTERAADNAIAIFLRFMFLSPFIFYV